MKKTIPQVLIYLTVSFMLARETSARLFSPWNATTAWQERTRNPEYVEQGWHESFGQNEGCLSVQILLLDGKAQSAEADEFVYHELLVHPAMLLHRNPKTVFVAGGTDLLHFSSTPCRGHLINIVSSITPEERCISKPGQSGSHRACTMFCAKVLLSSLPV